MSKKIILIENELFIAFHFNSRFFIMLLAKEKILNQLQFGGNRSSEGKIKTSKRY